MKSLCIASALLGCISCAKSEPAGSSVQGAPSASDSSVHPRSVASVPLTTGPSGGSPNASPLPTSCAWEQIAWKAKEEPSLVSEWRAVVERDWKSPDGLRARPSPTVSVRLAPGATVEALATGLGARFETVAPDAQAFRLVFPDAEAAVRSIRPLLCDDRVVFAAMAPRRQ